MSTLLQEEEFKDLRRREQQKIAQLEYQRALDDQVNALRQRSFDSLASKLTAL
jgi:hypothetical protein